MGDLAQLGEDVAEQAYEQLGLDGAVYAHSAALMAAGAQSVAQDIVRGMVHLDENQDVMRVYGFTRRELVDGWGERIRRLVGGMGEDSWNTIVDSTLAHYVETQSRRGRPGLNRAAVERSLNAVLGGTDQSSVLATINGQETVLPTGVDEERVEAWLDNAGEQEWARLNPAGMPRYLNGEVATLAQLRRFAQFQLIGGGEYLVQMDGMDLTTGVQDGMGHFQRYIVRLDDLPTPPRAPAPTPLDLSMAPL